MNHFMGKHRQLLLNRLYSLHDLAVEVIFVLNNKRNCLMKVKNKNLIVLSLAGSVGLSACGGGGGGNNVNTVPNSDLVYIADASVNGTYELFSTTRDSNEHTILTQASFGGGVDRDFQLSPNGRYVAFISEGDMPDVYELYVDDLDDDLPPVKVNSDLVVGGDVDSFQWSPNSNRLAYAADQAVDDQFDLYTVQPNGSQLTRVSGDMSAGGSLATNAPGLDSAEYAWSPNGQRLAYIADQDTDSIAELYTVMASGSGNVKINGDMAVGGDVTGFKWSPDSQRVLYRADQDTNTVYELYSSLSIGLINAKLNIEPVAGGDVSSRYEWSYDGSHVAFTGDLNINDKNELYTSGFVGADKVKISLNAIDFVRSIAWSPVEDRLVYIAVDQDRSDLYSVMVDGAQHAQLSDPMNPADAIVHDYEWAPDGSRVAIERYIGSSDDQIDLFTVTVDGLTRDQIDTQGEVGSFAWSPDSQSIAYRADQDTIGVIELYTATYDGQSITKVNGLLIAGGDVTRFKWSLDNQSLAYRADQDTDGINELFTVNSNGMNASKVSTALSPSGDVDTFQWRP